jgi:hypothetical protein
VAQALDYACWVDKLRAEDIAAIYDRFAPGRRLEDDFASASVSRSTRGSSTRATKS